MVVGPSRAVRLPSGLACGKSLVVFVSNLLLLEIFWLPTVRLAGQQAE